MFENCISHRKPCISKCSRCSSEGRCRPLATSIRAWLYNHGQTTPECVAGGLLRVKPWRLGGLEVEVTVVFRATKFKPHCFQHVFPAGSATSFTPLKLENVVKGGAFPWLSAQDMRARASTLSAPLALTLCCCNNSGLTCGIIVAIHLLVCHACSMTQKQSSYRFVLTQCGFTCLLGRAAAWL